MRQRTVTHPAWRGALVAAVVAAVALIGCGSGGGGGGGTTPPPGGDTNTRSLTGVVRDANGQPVSGVTVSAAGQTTTTAADGSWQLNNLPSTTNVTVTFSGTGFQTQSIVVPTTDSTPVQNVTLPPSGSGFDNISQPPPPPNFDEQT